MPPLVVDRVRVEGIRRFMPELPEARRLRFIDAYGLSEYDAAALVGISRAFADYFEGVVGSGADAKLAANWVMGAVRARMNELETDDVAAIAGTVPPDRLAGLIGLVQQGRISGPAAKAVFETMFRTGREAGEIVAEEGLSQIDDESALLPLVREVVARHGSAVAQYRSGKTAALGFLVGQVMKAAGAKANPRRISDLLKRELG